MVYLLKIVIFHGYVSHNQMLVEISMEIGCWQWLAEICLRVVEITNQWRDDKHTDIALHPPNKLHRPCQMGGWKMSFY